MLAAGMICGKPGSYAFDLPRPEIQQADQVLVRVKEVGLDGTDFGMVSRGQPDIAEGRNEVVMGYEMVGVVEAVGAWVTKLAASDTVTMTVRRWCGICHPCLHNQSDMCMTGLFTERGIHKIDGFLTRFVVGQEQYIVKEPANQVWCGVLTEPLSIAEKGVEQIRFIQARIVWACSNPSHSFDLQTWGGCRTGLVVGVRPLGILGTALLRLAGVDTYVADIVPEYSAKAQLVKQMGARYIHGRTKTPQEMVDMCYTAGNLDIIFEASGAATTAVELINHMSRSSIYVMTGIPREGVTMQMDAGQLVRRLCASTR